MTEATCRLQSLTAGESMAGSAPHVEHWLLVEYGSGWGRKALEDSDLPAHVKQALQRITAEVAHGRLGFIKQARSSGPSTVFAVTCTLPRPTLYRYTFDSWDGLLGADGPALFAGRTAGAAASTAPLFLVCTNGKRDRCCAEAGLPVYQALQSAMGDTVWQTSHIGGHRFAANLVCLPHGIVYGRVDQSNAALLAQQYHRGLIDIDHCRGRTLWPEPVQAAEIFCRQALQDPHLESLQVIDVDCHDQDTAVRFRTGAGEPMVVTVHAHPSEFTLQASCGTGSAETVTQYEHRRD